MKTATIALTAAIFSAMIAVTAPAASANPFAKIFSLSGTDLGSGR